MDAIERIFERESFYKTLPSFSEILFDKNVAFCQNKKIFIFGFCELGFKIANALKHSGVNIAGYIDNDTNKTGCFNNQIECKSIDYIENKLLDSYVIIAVIESIEAVQYQLLSFGLDINNIFYKRAEREKVGDDFRNYLVNCVVGCLAWEDKTSLRTKILSDSDLINEAYIKLADDKSREIFISRIALALDGERYGPLTHFLNSFSDTVIENRSKYKNSIYAPRPLPEFKYYFNQSFLDLIDLETYVDVGAEDGNTIIPFIERMYDLNKNYSKIFGFEPDPVVYPILKRTLGNLSNVTLLEKAIDEFEGKIGFVPSEMILQSRRCGYVKNDAENSAVATTLDSYFQFEKYTLIKIDPTGESIKRALKGGSRTIKKYKPKIIAGTYHSIENFYVIPNLIWSLNPEYKVYLRHLAFHANETHAFGIPFVK